MTPASLQPEGSSGEYELTVVAVAMDILLNLLKHRETAVVEQLMIPNIVAANKPAVTTVQYLLDILASCLSPPSSSSSSPASSATTVVTLFKFRPPPRPIRKRLVGLVFASTLELSLLERLYAVLHLCSCSENPDVAEFFSSGAANIASTSASQSKISSGTEAASFLSTACVHFSADMNNLSNVLTKMTTLADAVSGADATALKSSEEYQSLQNILNHVSDVLSTKLLLLCNVSRVSVCRSVVFRMGKELLSLLSVVTACAGLLSNKLLYASCSLLLCITPIVYCPADLRGVSSNYLSGYLEGCVQASVTLGIECDDLVVIEQALSLTLLVASRGECSALLQQVMVVEMVVGALDRLKHSRLNKTATEKEALLQAQVRGTENRLLLLIVVTIISLSLSFTGMFEMCVPFASGRITHHSDIHKQQTSCACCIC